MVIEHASSPSTTTTSMARIHLPTAHPTLIGLPYDASSSFLRGPALAPARIREELHSSQSNGCSERGIRVIADEGLRERFVKLGREVAEALTWDRCANATADVYREVLEDAC